MRNYLVVDDNREFAENLAEIIADAGDEAAVATTGSQAVELVRRRRFDALVTDMKMPVMDGAQLVHEIRRTDPGLAAIVITAYSGESNLSGASREGLLGILPKPVPLSQLLALLSVAKRDGLVALVEDDVELSDNVAEILRARGFSAVTARSLIETERLGAVSPFAALVDLKLPGSPQGEVLRSLSERYRDLPLIVITGYPELAVGGRSHIVLEKPFDTDKLLRTLERLHRPRASS